MCTVRRRQCNHHFYRLRCPDKKWLIPFYEGKALVKILALILNCSTSDAVSMILGKERCAV
jgi:hypothetical protein